MDKIKIMDFFIHSMYDNITNLIPRVLSLPQESTLVTATPWQNVYACANVTKSDQSLPRTLGFILCAACDSVVLLHAARVFAYFVVIEIAFMDNQAQITETISRLDSEKVS